MDTAETPTGQALSTRVAPLMPLALAMAAGIAADRGAGGPATFVWIAWACGLGMLGLALSRRRAGLAVVATCLAWGAAAGGWHHFRESDLAPDDLARAVDDAPRPAWVRGTLRDVAGYHPGDAIDDSGFTRAVLDVDAVHDRGAWRAASGRATLSVSGDRSDLAAGMRIEAAGALATPAGPLNPGEFDYRAFLRAEGVRLRLSVDEPSGVWPADDREDRRIDASGHLLSLIGRLRRWSHERLTRGLDPDASALAAALLLGRREGVAPEVNDAFARTGTSHLLAISGLHMQVLALAVGNMLTFLGVRRRRVYTTVAGATAAYALLVGLMPSVVRSAAMTMTYCFAQLTYRRARHGNTLALAAIVTLALNPMHLFDVGCQLSFLAVATIVWGAAPACQWLARERTTDPLAAVERHFAPAWTHWTRRVALWLLQGVLLSTIVWAAGLPLVMLRFHLASPIGVLLNIPLIPATSAALLACGASLGLGLVWEPLGAPAGWAGALLLRWTERAVRWGADQRWGHAFVPAPHAAWVAVFYALLALAAATAWRRAAVAALALWVALGLAALLAPPGLFTPPGPPEVDVLAVGHGLAVVVETEPGRAWLYDCGKMRDPSVGRRIVAPALWARGVRRLDAVVLSHADQDHFDGLPDLLDRFPIGAVLLPEGFDDPVANPAAAELLALVRRRGVPVRPVAAGERWSTPRFDLTVLHPPRGWQPAAPDNARSVVLDVSRDGRRILLTGDLEGPGLLALTSIKPAPTPVDVLLSPHHGGRAANPEWLYAWADPARVVVSQRPPQPGARDPLALLKSPVLRTWQSGAIRLRWTETGIEARGWREERSNRR